MANPIGQSLNDLWQVGAKHAHYREDGNWYHQLKAFPGALFDANGYVLFETEHDYLSSTYLQIQQDMHVPNGISSLPTYVRLTENGNLREFSEAVRLAVPRSTASVPDDGGDAQRLGSSPSDVPEGNVNPKRALVQSYRIVRETCVGIWVKACTVNSGQG